MPATPRSTYRLDPATKALLAALVARLGVSETDILRMAVRELARRNGLSA